MEVKNVEVIDESFDGKTYTIKIKTKYGVFEGKSYVHPEEPLPLRRFFGFSIAELRASIKYLTTAALVEDSKARDMETRALDRNIKKRYKRTYRALAEEYRGNAKSYRNLKKELKKYLKSLIN